MAEKTKSAAWPSDTMKEVVAFLARLDAQTGLPLASRLSDLHVHIMGAQHSQTDGAEYQFGISVCTDDEDSVLIAAEYLRTHGILEFTGSADIVYTQHICDVPSEPTSPVCPYPKIYVIFFKAMESA